jgi:hypothetical protein
VELFTLSNILGISIQIIRRHFPVHKNNVLLANFWKPLLTMAYKGGPKVQKIMVQPIVSFEKKD